MPTKSTTSRQKIELTVLIHNATKQAKVLLVSEYEFHPSRRWRADFAIPEMRILIEYEGINSLKSGHTTITGYTSNCEKYNQAAILGWKVLRYTFKNYGQFVKDWDDILADYPAKSRPITTQTNTNHTTPNLRV